MDNKCKRRTFLKTEEVRIYEASQRNKNRMIESLRMLGFPDKPLNEAYRDEVSQYAW
jgi:hypothetical protein